MWLFPLKLQGHKTFFLSICLRYVLPPEVPSAKYHQTENYTWTHITVNAWISQIFCSGLNCKSPVTLGRWMCCLPKLSKIISPEVLAGQCGAVQQCPGSLPCLSATPVVSSPWLHCCASHHGSLSLMWGLWSPRAWSASQAVGKQQPDQLLHSNPCCLSQLPSLPAALHQGLLVLSRARED